MNLQSKGVILSLRKFQEKKLLVQCFTEDYGILSGIFSMNFSKKALSFLVPGDIGFISWYGRLEDHLGYIKIENLNHIAASIHTNRYRLSILESILTLIQIFLTERQESKNLFSSVYDLILFLVQDNNNIDAIKNYCLFELQLLKDIGFGLDLKKCIATGKSEDLVYVSPKSGCAVSVEAGLPYHDKLLNLPNFFLNKEIKCLDTDIINALNLTGSFLHKAASIIGKDKNLSVRNNVISNLSFNINV
jgi:DNA repair protein RecO (recombination protein O)